jgi:hypothetical protein
MHASKSLPLLEFNQLELVAQPAQFVQLRGALVGKDILFILITLTIYIKSQ